MNLRKMISGIISYILALVLAVIFALFLSANVGWFMLVALILALVLSVFFALMTRRFVKVECRLEGDLLSKGDTYTMTVSVYNRSIFPSTPIELSILNGDGVKAREKNVLVSVMPVSVKSFKIEFEARISGPSYVGIEHVYITDYLGILKLKAGSVDYDKLRTKLLVIPDVADISPKDERILKVMQASLHADDSEDTVETTVNTFGGFPGYDNREYVPGDPLKRINWKQSAKRERLLVRLDDEMAAQSVNVVLDSVYKKWLVKPGELGILSEYGYCDDSEIVPKIAEDAVENALGIAKVLVLSSYTVNLYIAGNGDFLCYLLDDEKDVEDIRIDMADYCFDTQGDIRRIPEEVVSQKDGLFVFSTPNPYEDAYAEIEANADVASTSIVSAVEEAKCGNVSGSYMGFKSVAREKKSKNKLWSGVKEKMSVLLIPYLLAVVLSVTVFSAFRISPVSKWTILQMIFVLGLFVICVYVNKHRIIGTLLITILLFGILSMTMNIVFSEGFGTVYMQWFMSGGDVVDTTDNYLFTLILVFATFFALLIFYYTQARYRTSAVMLTSIIPFVVYAKIVREVPIGYVMAIIVLNVGVFLVNMRKSKDRGKRIVGYNAGLVSLGIYGLLFVLIALAVPKGKETKLYYMFEEAFLGGNTTTILPVQYTGNSDYSGNADDFNKLNNRKLYTITADALDEPLYLKRQVYDIYDYDINRWYGDKKYSEYKNISETNVPKKDKLNVSRLVMAMNEVEKHSPGFLKRYGMEQVADYGFVEEIQTLIVQTHNFASDFYIVPSRNILVETVLETYVTEHGVWMTDGQRLPRNVIYEVDFYEQYKNYDKWISLGGANQSLDTSIKMLEEMSEILKEAGSDNFADVVNAFYMEANAAAAYSKDCEDENDDIPKKVKELARELTKAYKYDWEKAEALAEYFAGDEFLYDLSYDAPDDSVEHFLFEGRTGTCSDFATAYVLLARAAGLTVRYVEGFVADEEFGVDYDVEYVVRTRSAHAYPEVYIPNYGYVVFEPTIAAVADEEVMPQGGVTGYVLTLGYRILLIFAAVSLVIIFIIIMVKVLVPYIGEIVFLHNVKRTEANRAAVMVYERIVKKHMLNLIADGEYLTPKEYAKAFERIIDYDLSELTQMIEACAYAGEVPCEGAGLKAYSIYIEVKQLIKNRKKHKKI